MLVFPLISIGIQILLQSFAVASDLFAAAVLLMSCLVSDGR
jgi:hypothetical protein